MLWMTELYCGRGFEADRQYCGLLRFSLGPLTIPLTFATPDTKSRHVVGGTSEGIAVTLQLDATGETNDGATLAQRRRPAVTIGLTPGDLPEILRYIFLNCLSGRRKVAPTFT